MRIRSWKSEFYETIFGSFLHNLGDEVESFFDRLISWLVPECVKAVFIDHQSTFVKPQLFCTFPDFLHGITHYYSPSFPS